MALARRSRSNLDIWPGFVDALATLLMVIIFLLMIFVISQLYLNEALVGRDRALDRLSRQVTELAEMLTLERAASEDLRSNVESLSQQLRASLTRRDELEASLGALRIERDAVLSRLERSEAERSELSRRLDAATADLARTTAELEDASGELARTRTSLDETTAELDRRTAELEETAARLDERTAELEETRTRLSVTRQELEDAYTVVQADRETIEAQLAELDRLSNDIRALRSLREELMRRVAAQEEQLEQRDRALEREEEAAILARAEAARLGQQVRALREQMAELNALLEESERRDAAAQVQIADLGRRLNVALASRVQELARYRSEFFGRLRQILGDRQDVRIVGDRFVFQSEVLFESASAELGEEGRRQMAALAETLVEISSEIPEDLPWILQVNGHTDRRPIATERFPSNWELSAARAISVVRFLNEQGIPAERLAATGFGEFQPLDPRDDEIAHRRNRRIELKLTQH